MIISKMNKGEWGKIVAFFDVDVEGLTIKGFKLIDAGNGKFVGFPSQKDKEGEYRDTVWASKDTKAILTGIATTKYDEDVTEDVKDIPF
jgi:DNA-binding cell septation regulator SpoVG